MRTATCLPLRSEQPASTPLANQGAGSASRRIGDLVYLRGSVPQIWTNLRLQVSLEQGRLGTVRIPGI